MDRAVKVSACFADWWHGYGKDASVRANLGGEASRYTGTASDVAYQSFVLTLREPSIPQEFAQVDICCVFDR